MKRAWRSAQRHDVDEKSGALGWFGPLRADRPLPVAVVVIPAVLALATLIAVASTIGAYS